TRKPLRRFCRHRCAAAYRKRIAPRHEILENGGRCFGKCYLLGQKGAVMRETLCNLAAASGTTTRARQRTFPTLVTALVALVLLASAHAQRCTANIQVGCTDEGAVCSPVTSGVGPKGRCATPSGFPKGERECNCVGAPPIVLSGTWLGDDGGLYYVRQIGNELWWAGFSTDPLECAADLHIGLAFTNVFHATISGSTASGDWVDVPRGQSLQNGTLTLTVSNNLIQRQAATGGF